MAHECRFGDVTAVCRRSETVLNNIFSLHTERRGYSKEQEPTKGVYDTTVRRETRERGRRDQPTPLTEMAEHHAAGDGKHKANASVHGNSRVGAASGGGGKGGLSGGLTQPAGWQSLLSFSILFLACLAGFSSRLFAVIRFESIIHEFDPW